VHYIQKYARAGLPVILSGGDPGVYTTHDSRDTPAIKQAIQALKQSRNVYSVSTGKVAAKLQTLGIKPQVALQTDGTWYSTWREDVQNGMDHAFVFCDGNASTGTVSIASSKTPIFLDPWTGQKKPVLEYTRHGNQVIIPLSLAANQTVVIGFIEGAPKPVQHATQLPSSVLGYDYSQESGFELYVSASKDRQSLILSNGKSVSISGTNVSEPSKLSNWTLTAEHWEAPSNISDVDTVAAKHNTTHDLSSLVSWTEIEALRNVSGLGYYSTSISWPPTGHRSADGAYLILPPISHAARIYVNGQKVPPIDFSAPRVDLGQYLKKGSNQITVVVPTTMWNYIRSIAGEIETADVPLQLLMSAVGYTTLPSVTDNGLIGTVTLVPYVKVHLE
jgi:hypothetical protein